MIRYKVEPKSELIPEAQAPASMSAFTAACWETPRIKVNVLARLSLAQSEASFHERYDAITLFNQCEARTIQ